MGLRRAFTALVVVLSLGIIWIGEATSQVDPASYGFSPLLKAIPQPLPGAEAPPTTPYHFPYRVAAAADLEGVTTRSQRVEYLHRDAAKAFRHMQEDARAEGASLLLLSGFRSIPDQVALFKRQTQRRGSELAALRLSAPPGYSEHHTGYALDVGDASQPQTHLQFRFDQTSAFRWLEAHASNYGFELSFPQKNPQGVSYEPWHWRYVGTAASQSAFAAARGL
jgi:D-alanyl-D-alanine carboxypeptidase